MGIKFLCPNGHKLNVKAFLSGKRAICPKCGAKVLVPTESQIGRSAPSATGSAPYPVGSLPLEQSVSIEVPLADVPPLNPVAVAEYFGDSEMAGIDLSSTARPVGAAVESLPREMIDDPMAPVSDPIDEAPTATWYMRSPSGEQFGPVTGDTMRAWLRDNRVSADALVWRAGWEQWKSAGVTFSLRTAVVPPPLVTPPAPPPIPPPPRIAIPVAAPPLPPPVAGPAMIQPPAPSIEAVVYETPVVEETPGERLRRVRKRKEQKQYIATVISVVLVMVTIILVIVLVAVLRSQKPTPDEKPEATALRAPAVEAPLRIQPHPPLQVQT